MAVFGLDWQGMTNLTMAAEGSSAKANIPIKLQKSPQAATKVE